MPPLSRRTRNRLRTAIQVACVAQKVLAGSTVFAQRAPSGDFVVLRDSDTISIERFTYERGLLRSEIVAGSERTWFTGRIGRNSAIDSIDLRYETAISRPRLRIGFGRRDYQSTFISGGETWRTMVTTLRRASPVLTGSIALLEHLLRAAAVQPSDSARVLVYALRDFDTATYVLSRPTADSAVIRFEQTTIRIALASDGSILGGTRQPGNVTILRRAATAPPRCSDALVDSVTFVSLPGRPQQALPSADGCWIFTSIAVTNSGWPAGVALLRNVGGRIELVRVLPLDRRPATLMTLTHDGALLIVPNGRSVTFIDTERLIDGQVDAIVGTLQGGGPRTGGAQATVTRNNRYLFVADEPNSTITVIDLVKARASHFAKSSIIGTIPTGWNPFAVTLSRDEKLLYFLNESAPDWLKWPSDCHPEPALDVDHDHPQGAILVAEVSRAVVDPAHSVVAAAPAGCIPVRLSLSPSNRTAYVVARKDEALLAINTRAIMRHAKNAIIARVPTGPAPSDLALSSDGATAYVTNSNRWASSITDKQTVSVIDTRRMREGRGAIVGTIATLAYPNQIRILPNGRTMVWSNVNSGNLQFVDLARLLLSRASSPPP